MAEKIVERQARKMTRIAYVKLIEGNLEWLRDQPETLERDHIELIILESVNIYYPSPI